MKPRYLLLLVMFIFIGNMIYAQNISDDSLRVIVREEMSKHGELRTQIDRLAVIATKRVEVKKLNNAGNVNALIQGYESEEKQLLDVFKTKNKQAISDKMVEIKLIYKNIAAVEDRILYDKALVDYESAQYVPTQNTLEDFLNRFPNSNKFNQAVALLQKIYILTGQDNKLVDMYSKISTEKTDDQVFALGQAFYNLGQYTEASENFNKLTSDKTYGLRSNAMLALIMACTENTETALSQFLKLKEQYKTDTPYYDFLMLSIARLYADAGKFDDALTYYTEYLQLNQNASAIEIKYEMAVALKNAKRYDQSIALFNTLLKDPQASEFYTSSIYLIAYMKGLQGDYTGGKSIIEASRKQNADILALIDEKHQALDRLRVLRDQFFKAEDKNLRISNIDEMTILEKKISDIDVVLTTKTVGVNPDELKKLRSIEDKYITYHNLITQEVLKINLLKNKSNEQKTAVIDRNIAILDSTFINALAYNLLANLPEVSDTKYQIAHLMAREIWEEKKALNDWKQIAEVARKSGNSALTSKTLNAVNSLEENISSLELAVSHYFGNYSSNPEKEKEIKQTLQDIIATRDSLASIREDVAKNFNRKLAAKLLTDTKSRASQGDEILKVYNQQFSNLNNRINVMSKQYDYTLLELQYIKTMNDDILLQKDSERTDQTDQGTGSR